jgi:hypothetical protein
MSDRGKLTVGSSRHHRIAQRRVGHVFASPGRHGETRVKVARSAGRKRNYGAGAVGNQQCVEVVGVAVQLTVRLWRYGFRSLPGRPEGGGGSTRCPLRCRGGPGPATTVRLRRLAVEEVELHRPPVVAQAKATNPTTAIVRSPSGKSVRLSNVGHPADVPLSATARVRNAGGNQREQPETSRRRSGEGPGLALAEWPARPAETRRRPLPFTEAKIHQERVSANSNVTASA